MGFGVGAVEVGVVRVIVAVVLDSVFVVAIAVIAEVVAEVVVEVVVEVVGVVVVFASKLMLVLIPGSVTRQSTSDAIVVGIVGPARAVIV